MTVLAPEIEATYEVLSKMGEGGMGAVYKVRHRFFDEIRVIKVMQAHLETAPELKERFLGEAKRGKQLRHPNLAEVLDFSIAGDGTAYMVMEFIEGTNLREVLARNEGPLQYDTVVPIAEQVLDALGYLHSRKFVHRDISPDNIMLVGGSAAEPRVKLIDLGISKSLEATRQLTMAGKFIGKVKYAAPEQFSGTVDGRSDLYSLGVVLYELLTGEMPITGKDNLSVIAGVVSRPPRAFEETDPQGRVPPRLRQAVMKALEKSPDDRFQTTAEFRDALRDAIAPEVTEIIDIPPPPPRPTRRWLAVSAVAALLLVAAIGALLYTRRTKDVPAPAVTTTTSGTTVTVVEPPKPATGQLLVNALPWGEVRSVRDAAGVEQLAGGVTETPLLLTLPAGSYKVTLANPNSQKTVVLDATVDANALARCEAELDRVDAASYVDRAGIGR